MSEAGLLSALKALVGEAHVLTDEASRRLYAQDVWATGEPGLAVVAPADAAELAQVVRTVTRQGAAVIARGGGMSYTRGYVPSAPGAVIVDTARMNRVLEINHEDMYVTVEAGCTWKTLHEALKGSGLRTPFWGTLSGSKATVGGGVSQNSIFWGCGHHGSAADSVLSLQVVLADGSVLNTGSAAQLNSTPFFRHFGPDLTGLFTCDTGALGIKAAVTLRLLRELPARGFASFDMPGFEGLLVAMAEIARRGLASECFGFDPGLTEQRAQRDRLMSDVKALTGVLKNSDSVWGAIKDGASIALAGRRFMKDLQWPLHVSVEERNAAAVESVLAEVRGIVSAQRGREVENSIPKILRANPFGPVNNMIGPGGERWVPVHGLLPLSKAVQATEVIQGIFAEHAEDIQRLGVITGYLFASVGNHCIAVEPVFFWPDQQQAIHEHSVEPEYWKRLPKLAANPRALAVVARLRQQIIDAFRDMGAVHLQIGKTYHYAGGLKPEALGLVRAVKQAVDPYNRMNPGTLGL